ncbi:hypothetical protein JZ751_016259 [Albula glossodonta]|uniref:ZAD domain-containing protein n=1 Tax=Albula glossodonta TaxID=121402 RepID=A0A8T2MWD8_9TELE|nr:hypothetical protein JZ751_016259 [Albula glossodonta]
MASPGKPVLSSASKLLTNVCRVCGNAFCDNNKNKCNLFQGKNSAIKPDFTVALEKLTGPITPGDYLLSVCLQCKRLLDRYHRCSGEVERIARSIQEKTRENDRIRMKRCSAAAPSQEAKRQRVSPPATQSGAGEHPLNAVSPSIPTIGMTDLQSLLLPKPAYFIQSLFPPLPKRTFCSLLLLLLPPKPAYFN